MIYPVRIQIGKIRPFQPVSPLMRSHVFARRMAYWHARIMRMSGRPHSWTRAPRITRLQIACARAWGYTRTYMRKHKHAPNAQYPRCVTYADINLSPIS